MVLAIYNKKIETVYYFLVAGVVSFSIGNWVNDLSSYLTISYYFRLFNIHRRSHISLGVGTHIKYTVSKIYNSK